MGIPIPGDEQNLKKEHAGCPDSRTPPVPWQNVFADQRLNLEQEK
jgi:hypothetical protein